MGRVPAGGPLHIARASERFFNKLKHSTAVVIRFDKHDANYLALVRLAAAQIWMRFVSR